MKKKSSTKNLIQDSIIVVEGNFHQGDVIYYILEHEVRVPNRLTNNIPFNAEHILGRIDELKQTEKLLKENQTTVLFNGIGGIGKTSIASKYMVLKKNNYKHLGWITVQTSLADAFLDNAPLLSSLKITRQVQEYINSKQIDKAFDFLFHQLNQLEPTLIVIDNANDVEDLEKYKNFFDTANCHFLITSRSKPSEWAYIEVDILSKNEAMLLFRTFNPLPDVDDIELDKLLSFLYYHTLLIELVSKSSSMGKIPFDELIIMVERQFIHHQSLNNELVPTGKHGSVIPSNLKRSRIQDYIWLIFSQVKTLGIGFQNTLKAMTLLPAATPFEINFLLEHFNHFKIKNGRTLLNQLTEHGWIHKDENESSSINFSMHPLVLDVVVKHLYVRVDYANSYIKFISDKIHYDDSNIEHKLTQKKEYKPFADHLLILFIDSNTEEISYLLDRVGYIEQHFGFYERSIEKMERALEIVETIFDKNNVLIADRKNNLGWSYRLIGQYDKAFSMLISALEINTQYFNEDHPTIITNKSNLAAVYMNIGKYDEAIDLFEHVLESNIRVFGKKHPIIAQSQNNLGWTCQLAGKLDYGAQLIRTALKSNIQNFGTEHQEVAICQSNLGWVYQQLGKNKQAAKLLESALNYDLKTFGQEHPKIAIRKSMLGIVYSNLKKFDIAIKYIQEAMDSDIKYFGQNHPNIALRQNNLARVYQDMGKSEEAKDLWRSAYQNYLHNFGEKHPLTIRFKTNSEIE